MFSRKEVKQNCFFVVGMNDGYFLLESGKTCMYNIDNELLWKSSLGGEFLIPLAGSIVTGGTDSVFKLNEQTGKLELQRKNFRLTSNSISDVGFIVDDLNSSRRTLSLMNESLEVLWTQDIRRGKVHFLSSKNFFCTEFGKNSLLYSISNIDGKVNWKRDFKDYCLQDNNTDCQVMKIIDLYNNRIWTSISNKTVVAINTETSGVEFKLREIPGFNCEWLPPAIPNEYSMCMNSDAGKVIGFRWEFYWEIDCLSGDVELTDLTEQFKEARIRSDAAEFVLDQGFIYFFQHRPGKLGVFDTNAKEIVWEYLFETGVTPNQVSYAGHNIFVRDIEGNLHVFEKNGFKNS